MTLAHGNTLVYGSVEGFCVKDEIRDTSVISGGERKHQLDKCGL
jgi:hypothetical protein